LPRTIGTGLSRREREIMDAVYRLGKATAGEILEAMPDPPSYSAVRTQLSILEEKGHLTHTEDGRRFVYLPTRPRQDAARSALNGVLKTFFGGNLGNAVQTLLSDEERKLSEQELDELSALIESAREKNAEVEP
jgi:predicted transcriptional regulator